MYDICTGNFAGDRRPEPLFDGTIHDKIDLAAEERFRIKRAVHIMSELPFILLMEVLVLL
jgi:hypothetical protein